jgi:putative oxidoreductase
MLSPQGAVSVLRRPLLKNEKWRTRLLFSGFFVPLALTLLAAELYNILAFHLTTAPGSIAPALVACVLWILVFLQYRGSFNGIFSAKPATP